MAWRGYFSSAETAGEFYGIAIMFLIFPILKYKKLNPLSLFLVCFPLLGLYLSNNRTVSILLVAGFVFYFLNTIDINAKFKAVFVLLVIISTVLFIGIDKFTYIYSYQSIYIQANSYSVEYDTSTYLNLINSKYGIEKVFTLLFSIFTFLGYVLNRSELWGLFLQDIIQTTSNTYLVEVL